MTHLENNNILCDEQHGFRAKRSCETQLLELTHELFNNLEQGRQTDILILDFAKAFDKVNHSLLIHKLHYYGVRGDINRWIKDFLSGRQQAVVVNGEHSDLVPVKSGVPQGSVLGPCLFLAYINDLPANLKSKARLFADDTAVYNVVRNTDGRDQLQEDLDQLAIWEDRWLMSFHPDKCINLPISRSRNPHQSQYSLHGHTLETVSSAKYLGVTIKSDLSWDSHVNQITAKANRTLGFLRRNLKVSSRKTKVMAYKALVRPTMEYACSVWDPHGEDSIKRLEAVQRRAARFVMRRYHNTASPTYMLEELKWPSLQSRRKTSRLAMLFKIQSGQASTSGIKECLTPAPVRQRRSNSRQLVIPRSRTLYRQQSFLPKTITEWNLLPEASVAATTVDAFVSSVASLQ